MTMNSRLFQASIANARSVHRASLIVALALVTYFSQDLVGRQGSLFRSLEAMVALQEQYAKWQGDQDLGIQLNKAQIFL